MGKQWKQWQTLGFRVPKPADSDCSHEIKRRLLLGRKAMTYLDSILKSRHYFASKGPSSQNYGFSSSHVRCDSWTIKKAECWRIDAFELWCWRRLLRVPWTGRRSNQSILKEINSECPLEELMLKLKLPYFGHLKRWADSLEKTLMLGKIEGRRRKGWQKMRWLNDIINSVDMSSSKLLEIVKDKESMGSQSLTRLSDWTKKTWPQGDSSTHELY